MSKILLGIIAAMGSTGFLYYQFAVVPMKNKIEEYNGENPPTSISEADPPADPDLDWKNMYLL